MDEPGTYIGLGARTRRIFIAFLISNFAFPVQVWLGIEYRKLAAEMGEIGRKDDRAGFFAASRLFKIASTLCIVLFATGIVGIAASYTSMYFEIGRLIQGMNPPIVPLSSFSAFSFMYYLFPLAVVQAGLGIASCLVVRKAWYSAQGVFRASTRPAVSGECSGKVDRILKGLRWSLVNNCLSVPIVTLLLVVFSMMGTLVSSGIAPSVLDLYMLLLVAILMLAIALAAGLLGLLGTINQGIGLFDLSKILQDRSKMGVMSTAQTGSDARDIAGAREALAYCPSCGYPLPRAPNLHYCPICGVKVA
nr:hypothetical protein [Candidatus Sigynarchaeum springense]